MKLSKYKRNNRRKSALKAMEIRLNSGEVLSEYTKERLRREIMCIERNLGG